MLQLAHRYVRARPSTAVRVDASSHHVVFLRVCLRATDCVCEHTCCVCVLLEKPHTCHRCHRRHFHLSLFLFHTLSVSSSCPIAHLVFHLSAFVSLLRDWLLYPTTFGWRLSVRN